MTRRLDTLSLAATAFVAANVLHTLDHLRQGTGDLATEVLAGGTVLSALAGKVSSAVDEDRTVSISLYKQRGAGPGPA